MHNFNKKRDENGFTLVELLVTLTVAAILLAIATPSFFEIIKNNRLTTQANDLLGSIQMARTEAVKRRVPVTFRCNDDGDPSVIDCREGWQVFTDWNRDGVYNGTASSECTFGQECLLQTHDALIEDYTLVKTNDQSFSYDSRGFPARGLGTSTFTLCPPDGDLEDVRLIKTNNTGRPRVLTREEVEAKVAAGDVICP